MASSFVTLDGRDWAIDRMAGRVDGRALAAVTHHNGKTVGQC
jgi:hypothetical protein